MEKKLLEKKDQDCSIVMSFEMGLRRVEECLGLVFHFSDLKEEPELNIATTPSLQKSALEVWYRVAKVVTWI